MHEVDRKMMALAPRQHGLVTHQQVLECGGSRELVRRRCEMGWWRRVERGVYAVGGVPMSWEAKVLATCLAGDAVASHRTAAVLLGVDGYRPGRVEVTVPREVRFRRPAVRVHQSTDLDLARIVTCRGIPTTDAARLMVDIGAVVPIERVEETADDLLVRKLVTWPSMLESLLRHARRGRSGVGKARALLELRYGDEHIPLSRWARMMQRLLVDAGLPEPIAEFRIYDGDQFVAQVDLAWPDRRVAIELDSKRYHLHAAAFERDPVRRAEIELLGWRVITITWRRMVEEPAAMCRQIRRFLDA
jgi:hypothetical protein